MFFQFEKEKKKERSEIVINANRNPKFVMHNQTAAAAATAAKSHQSTHDYQIRPTTRLVSAKESSGVVVAVPSNIRSRATSRHIQTLNYFTIFIYILLSVCCFNNVNSHESNYYYYYNSEGDGKLTTKNISLLRPNSVIFRADFLVTLSNHLVV